LQCRLLLLLHLRVVLLLLLLLLVVVLLLLLEEAQQELLRKCRQLLGLLVHCCGQVLQQGRQTQYSCSMLACRQHQCPVASSRRQDAA
jgi:hypothetical protein